MNIVAYLKGTGLAQAEFAALIGVSQGRVSQWIAGQTVPQDRAIAIETATAGAVTCEDLRPDVAWQRSEDGAVTGYTVPVKSTDQQAA